MNSIQPNATGRGSSPELPPLSVSVVQAAKILGCSPRVFGGGPKWFRIGSRCLYALTDLNEFVASQARHANTAGYAGGSR